MECVIEFERRLSRRERWNDTQYIFTAYNGAPCINSMADDLSVSHSSQKGQSLQHLPYIRRWIRRIFTWTKSQLKPLVVSACSTITIHIRSTFAIKASPVRTNDR